MTREEAQAAIEAAYAEYQAIAGPADEQYRKDVEGTHGPWPMGSPAPMPEVQRNHDIKMAAQRKRDAITSPAFAACVAKVNQIKREAGIE